jgi:hypothetical protein
VPDWSQLHHAYGPADDLPALLAALSPDPDAPVWDELWSRLCHQGTVYPASFAALPRLADHAAACAPADRLAPLALAGAIVASIDVKGSPTHVDPPTLTRLQELADESLTATVWSRGDFVHMLQAALACRGVRPWGRQLDHLADGEFPGTCPGCGDDLYIVIGDQNLFITAEDWVRHPRTARTPIEPREGELPGAGAWMLERALAARQPETAEALRALFGTGTCPRCRHTFAIASTLTG